MTSAGPRRDDRHPLTGNSLNDYYALGWKVLSERENEIVIGTGERAPIGICFMPRERISAKTAGTSLRQPVLFRRQRSSRSR